ncbi:Transcription factor bHLH35 [Glycine soja]|nr:Transcription factor bHLH35 [Glycine soja]
MMRPCRVLQLVSLHWWAYKEILLPKRNRRKKLNERLFVLGSVVPNISKHLQEQEKIIQAEIMELELGIPKKCASYDFELEQLPVVLWSNKKITEHLYDSQKDTDTVVKLCEVFESLKVKIVTANITSFSDRLLKTSFIEF